MIDIIWTIVFGLVALISVLIIKFKRIRDPDAFIFVICIGFVSLSLMVLMLLQATGVF